jgi:hypothetical protein
VKSAGLNLKQRQSGQYSGQLKLAPTEAVTPALS